MGFFNSAVSKGRRFIGTTGKVLRKVGDFAAPIVNKIGQYARPVGDAATILSTALGQPEVGKVINRAADFFASGKASDLVGKASAIGARMQAFGNG